MTADHRRFQSADRHTPVNQAEARHALRSAIVDFGWEHPAVDGARRQLEIILRFNQVYAFRLC